ncbi:hypothetical protein [Victivallis sp. Marseille-Q1083]|uniref:phage major capsid protein n=1 Tax=Victivallis sp. Marseille-Q1083 TaxID=2717288 RepID=UPI00158C48DC|nr:hypothetical protein [Victivallis sp. Marseille-Q1083]
MNEFVLIEAAGSRPKVNGLAYSGGKMKLPGWKHPVVVDLAGMSIPESVPLLTNHENHTSSRVGLVHAAVAENQLTISGEIVAEGDKADGIVAQAKAGADWQLSIGAEVEDAELVQGKRPVNGIEHAGPFYHIKKSTLREVSVVAVGADSSTQMKVTAQFKLKNTSLEVTSTAKPHGMMESGVPEKYPKLFATQKDPSSVSEGGNFLGQLKGEMIQMNETETKIEAAPEVQATAAVPAPAPDTANAAMQSERERVLKIHTLCNGEFPEVEAKAITDGWDAATASEHILAAYRAKQPSADVNIVVKTDAPATRKTLEAAMCLRAGIAEDVMLKAYGEQTLEAAMPDMDMPLKNLMLECMCIEGMSVPRSFDNAAIQAAFSTVSLPGILSNVDNKKLLQSYEAQPITALKLCSTGDLNDFKENDRFRLTDVGDLLPVAPDGEIKDGGLIEEGAKNQLDTYGKKFCLTRRMIINDDLGAFMKVPVAMGNRAARLIDQLFFSRLLANPVQADGKNLFHNAHKNLLGGAASTLSGDSLKKAIQMYLDQIDGDNQPISVEPRYLVVPTSLKYLAIELTRGATLIMSGSTENTVRPSVNVLADENLQVVSSPYLANSAYPGASANSWYLFGAPGQVDTFEIGYLKGKRTPTVERGDLDFNVLGMWFRVYFDVGVREQDHRGMLKANGAA